MAPIAVHCCLKCLMQRKMNLKYLRKTLFKSRSAFSIYFSRKHPVPNTMRSILLSSFFSPCSLLYLAVQLRLQYIIQDLELFIVLCRHFKRIQLENFSPTIIEIQSLSMGWFFSENILQYAVTLGNRKRPLPNRKRKLFPSI